MVTPPGLIRRLIKRRKPGFRPDQLGPATIDALYRAIPDSFRKTHDYLFDEMPGFSDMYAKTRVVMTYNDNSGRRAVEKWFEQAILLSGHPAK